MNCRQFQEILFEYVEGSMPQEQRAQADAHLSGCAECNAALRREQQIQVRLNSGLKQTVEAVNLGSQGRAQLLKILENNGGQRSRAQVFAELWVRVAAAFGAATVIAVVAMWALRPKDSRPIAEAIITMPLAVQVPQDAPRIQIRLPGLATSYTFQQNGEFVVDTFIEQTNFVNVTLWNGNSESPGPE